MHGSSLSTNTCGRRTRAAMAISSTMFIRRLRLGSLSAGVTGTPPSERATIAPPARSSELLCQDAISIVPMTMMETHTMRLGAWRTTCSGFAPRPSMTTRLMTAVTNRKARTNPTTSQRV